MALTGESRRKWFSLLGLGLALTYANGQSFTLKNNDTVVFYGDSITAQRLYTRFVEDFVLTRYPALHVRFINAGVSGDTTYGGYAGAMAERVQRDVVPFHPAMITIMLGMNDGGYVPESPEVDAAFTKGYRELVVALRKAMPTATITLVLPSPYDEITHDTEFPGYSLVLQKNAEDVSKLDGEFALSDTNLRLADFYHPLVDGLNRAKLEFPMLAPLIIPDRIHPAETGHWIMAAALLSAWHVDPVISRVSFNASTAQVLEEQRTSITKVGKTSDGLRWTQLDQALPLPLDFNNAMTSVLLAISNVEPLDQQILRVEGLDAGKYQLLIDSKPIGSFSSADLKRGVNLALCKTPMLDQARGIDWYEERRNTLDQSRFILSADLKQTSSSPVAENKLREAEDELAATIRSKLDPKPHDFALRRQ